MSHLETITNYALFALLATAVWAPLLINLLYRFDIVVKQKLMPNRMNAEFMKIHGHKVGTPTLGGLMISVTVGVLALILLPASDLKTVFLLFWTLFTGYGLADGLLVYARKLSTRFKLLEASFEWRLGKLGALYLLVLAALYVIVNLLGVTQLNLLGLVLDYQPWLLPVGAFLMVVAIYGIEITDGADGLVTGQFLMALTAYLVITVLTGHTELLPIVSMILGSSLVYLYFNINPARVFMGGTGTFPIAFALLFFALLTNTVDIFAIIGVIFWVEVASSGLQILSLKFFKRKLFRIAPIHHYFEAIGWSETKTVQRFWLFSALASLVALWVLSLTR
jgi:phospho-N-acetylmuramoyl-pentapeptide-transferase